MHVLCPIRRASDRQGDTLRYSYQPRAEGRRNRCLRSAQDGDTVISEQRKTLQLTGDDKVMRFEIVLSGIRDVELWDLDNPRLYTCEAYLVDSNISDCAADCAGCDRGVDKGVLDRFQQDWIPLKHVSSLTASISTAIRSNYLDSTGISLIRM